MKFLVKMLSTGFFLGYMPIAPGTFGTLLGVLLFYLLWPLPHYIYSVTLVTLILFASWISTLAEGVFNERDSQKIVIDEVVGYLVAVAFHPWGIFNAVAAFVLFRLFDITKPFPIGLIDRKLRAGWGVVFDDVLAGVYANICLVVIKIFI